MATEALKALLDEMLELLCLMSSRKKLQCHQSNTEGTLGKEKTDYKKGVLAKSKHAQR